MIDDITVDPREHAEAALRAVRAGDTDAADVILSELIVGLSQPDKSAPPVKKPSATAQPNQDAALSRAQRRPLTERERAFCAHNKLTPQQYFGRVDAAARRI